LGGKAAVAPNWLEFRVGPFPDMHLGAISLRQSTLAQAVEQDRKSGLVLDRKRADAGNDHTRGRRQTLRECILSFLDPAHDDISTLFYLPNISGVITSRALFGGTFTFREANAIATAQQEPTAPFL
jgi:hypothetical protein